MPDPDAASLLDWASCCFAQLGMAPAPRFSPLSGAAQTSEEEPWSWGWATSALSGPISRCLEVKKI